LIAKNPQADGAAVKKRSKTRPKYKREGASLEKTSPRRKNPGIPDARSSHRTKFESDLSAPASSASCIR